MKQITPYLFFDGNCREVINFYSEVFKIKPYIMTVGESPEASKMPESKDRIMHAALMKNDTVTLMASDTMMPGQKAEMGEGNYSTIICDSKDEIEDLFQKLSEGGKVNMPLEEAFFGWFGSLTDKFGVKWMLEFDKPEKHE
jgi:PhnB protein